MAGDFSWAGGAEIAEAVASGKTSVSAVVDDALARIAALNPALNAFTAVTAERARKRAKALDAGDKKRLPLAGVPFAVKNLFDIEGLTTVAGSKINRAYPPAKKDSPLIERLEAAGAVLVGALNMGEYAYDFTGENIHDGPSRNPHDLTRMSGGSSGGSGSAVGGGMVPLALGSDTNGSIRVPSSLCGIFGLKPTYGRLTRARSFPFVASLDHLGPFARSTRDLALSYDAMQGPDADDPACAQRAVEPTLPLIAHGAEGLRVAAAGGYFKKGAFPEALTALDRVAKALGVSDEVEIPEAQRARAAAYVISATEGAALHMERLRQQARDFDPAVRDRLLAARHGAGDACAQGANLPPLVSRARARTVQDFRRHPGAGDALHRAEDRPADLHTRRRRIAGAAQCRHLHAADLLHRPAGGCGAGAARAAADRRADHRAAMARGYRAARGAGAGRSGRGGRAAAGDRGAGGREEKKRGRMTMDVDLPEVVAEVQEAFERYEKALVGNDVAALDAMFRNDPRTIRYGGTENLYGYAEIEAFRAARSPVGLGRTLSRTSITTFGREFAVAATLYERPSAPGKIGRQMQTWVKFPEGWRVVAAHVSLIDAPREAGK